MDALPEEERENEDSDQHQQVASALLSSIMLDSFDVSKTFNPDLQQFYKGMQALALKQAIPNATDPVQRIRDEVQQRALAEIGAFRDQLLGEHFDAAAAAAALESKSERERRLRKEKEEQRRAEMRAEISNDPEWDEAMRNKDFTDFSLKDLKYLCQAFGLKISGTKKELVSRLDTVEYGEKRKRMRL